MEESKRFDVYRESGYISKKLVEVTFCREARDVEGCDIREPVEEARNERDGFIGDCDGEP